MSNFLYIFYLIPEFVLLLLVLLFFYSSSSSPYHPETNFIFTYTNISFIVIFFFYSPCGLSPTHTFFPLFYFFIVLASLCPAVMFIHALLSNLPLVCYCQVILFLSNSPSHTYTPSTSDCNVPPLTRSLSIPPSVPAAFSPLHFHLSIHRLTFRFTASFLLSCSLILSDFRSCSSASSFSSFSNPFLLLLSCLLTFPLFAASSHSPALPILVLLFRCYLQTFALESPLPFCLPLSSFSYTRSERVTFLSV